jgi:hypothetical protein
MTSRDLRTAGYILSFVVGLLIAIALDLLDAADAADG